MPTFPQKARTLLKEGKAKVINRTPFTIQLTIATGEATQPITLGVDAGSKVVGLSASTQKEELYASETTLRNDIVELLAERRQCRQTRRNRLRYREPRFDNRVHSKREGWFAPSVQHKIESHLKLVSNVHKLLPVSRIIVEVASFDIQKIKNPDIQGIDYQQGGQLDFWNVREYVLWRDGHTCQHCHGKSKDKILNVHHIESRKTGGDAPGNLITLCETCHKLHHEDKITLNVKRGASFRDAAFMGIMRWGFYNQLKKIYLNVAMTYGYITKNTRISNNIEKTHAADAYCISGNMKANKLDYYYNQRKVRCHNRQIHKANLVKGGMKKANQAPKFVFGYQLFDKVLYDNRECFIYGRRTKGSFDIRMLDGTKVTEVTPRKLKILEKRKTMLTERSARFG